VKSNESIGYKHIGDASGSIWKGMKKWRCTIEGEERRNWNAFTMVLGYMVRFTFGYYTRKSEVRVYRFSFGFSFSLGRSLILCLVSFLALALVRI